MLVGLDGSPGADVALEQAILLAREFHASIVVAHVTEPSDIASRGAAGRASRLLADARRRVADAGVEVEIAERRGTPDLELAELSRGGRYDVVLIGRTGMAGVGAVGPAAAAMLRTTEVSVVVCASKPSPMRNIVVAFDGQDESRRALELAGRFASIVESTVHIVHANADRDAGLLVVGEAEALLSLSQVAFQTHVEAGRPADVAVRVAQRVLCDVLFAGAHTLRNESGHTSQVTLSPAEDILHKTDIPVVIQP
jgi:nucleotide-binding universal stress UspA family protein